jgi:hypothetical protein
MSQKDVIVYYFVKACLKHFHKESFSKYFKIFAQVSINNSMKL